MVIIGIDIDGVCRDLYTKLDEVVFRENDNCRLLIPRDKRSRIVGEWYSIGDDVYDLWFKDHMWEIYFNSSPYSDIAHLNRLKDVGHKIFLLTNQPNEGTILATLYWLSKVGICYDSICFTPEKERVNCDLYIDDDPEYLKEFIVNDKKYVVRTQPWNKKIGGWRVGSLQEFVENIIGEIYEV